MVLRLATWPSSAVDADAWLPGKMRSFWEDFEISCGGKIVESRLIDGTGVDCVSTLAICVNGSK